MHNHHPSSKGSRVFSQPTHQKLFVTRLVLSIQSFMLLSPKWTIQCMNPSMGSHKWFRAKGWYFDRWPNSHSQFTQNYRSMEIRITNFILGIRDLNWITSQLVHAVLHFWHHPLKYNLLTFLHQFLPLLFQKPAKIKWWYLLSGVFVKDTLSQQTLGPYMSKVMTLLIIEKYGRFILKSVLFACENPIPLVLNLPTVIQIKEAICSF